MIAAADAIATNRQQPQGAQAAPPARLESTAPPRVAAAASAAAAPKRQPPSALDVVAAPKRQPPSALPEPLPNPQAEPVNDPSMPAPLRRMKPGSDLFVSFASRSEGHTSDLQSPGPLSYAVFC